MWWVWTEAMCVCVVGVQRPCVCGGYDLEDIKSKALAMGMVPKSELQTMAVTVTVPAPEVELTRGEEIKLFLEGLFA